MTKLVFAEIFFGMSGVPEACPTGELQFWEDAAIVFWGMPNGLPILVAKSLFLSLLTLTLSPHWGERG